MKQIETQYHHTLKSLERLLEEFKGTDEEDVIRNEIEYIEEIYSILIGSRSTLKRLMKTIPGFCSKVRERNYKTI